jgi:dipeptidyl aminopeptidase/acylaminoacyl peptidase
VSKEFLEEAHKINLASNIKSVKCPVLIVHGTEDDVVSYHDSEKLFESANKPKEIKIIKGADHTFHDEKHEKEVIKISLEWFNKYLK